jgi:uncharacterized membrane protein
VVDDDYYGSSDCKMKRIIIGIVLAIGLVLGVSSTATAKQNESPGSEVVTEAFLAWFYLDMSTKDQRMICKAWHKQPAETALVFVDEILSQLRVDEDIVVPGILDGLTATCGFSEALAEPLPFVSGFLWNVGLDVSGELNAAW